MSALHRLDDWFVGRVSFPATNYLLNRRGVLASYRELRKSERFPQEQLEEMQLRRLRAVLGYAYRFCPYYTHKFKQLGLAPDDIRSLEDARHIPAMSKQEVVEHGEEMIDMRYRRFCRRKARLACLVNPASQYRWRDSAAANWLEIHPPARPERPVSFMTTARSAPPVGPSSCASNIGTASKPEPERRGWSASRPSCMPNSRQIWARKRLWHRLMLPGSNMTDKEYAFCLRKLREFKPRVLWGYTAALAGLAEYVQRSGEDISSFEPELAIGWAAPVYEHEEKLIKNVFGCAVSNIYGSREVGHIAAWCPNHTWHINQEHVLVESNADPAQGELGEIIVTPLSLSPMPFIRYRLGDIGHLANSECACGTNPAGNAGPSGADRRGFRYQRWTHDHAAFWNRVFMVGQQSQFVERFQIVYRRPDLISIRVVKRDGLQREHRTGYKADLAEELQPGSPLSV